MTYLNQTGLPNFDILKRRLTSLFYFLWFSVLKVLNLNNFRDSGKAAKSIFLKYIYIYIYWSFSGGNHSLKRWLQSLWYSIQLLLNSRRLGCACKCKCLLLFRLTKCMKSCLLAGTYTLFPPILHLFIKPFFLLLLPVLTR